MLGTRDFDLRILAPTLSSDKVAVGGVLDQGVLDQEGGEPVCLAQHSRHCSGDVFRGNGQAGGWTAVRVCCAT